VEAIRHFPNLHLVVLSFWSVPFFSFNQKEGERAEISADWCENHVGLPLKYF
jgi:hypothetical protein